MVPAGNEYVLFRGVFSQASGCSTLLLRISERGAEVVGNGYVWSGIFAPSANGLLLFLKTKPFVLPPALTGGAISYGVFDAEGNESLLVLNDYPDSAFGKLWQRILALGVLS
jgi:hypothetical protein